MGYEDVEKFLVSSLLHSSSKYRMDRFIRFAIPNL